MSTITIKSHFDPNDIDDPSNPYPRPLFLVPLPPLDCQLLNNANEEGRAVDMLAYGGDDGCIYLLNNHHSSSTNSSSTSNNNDENKNNEEGAPPSSSSQQEPIVIRKYDDEVRSLAISNDGKRIAVGFDDGSTKIYSYDDYVVSDEDGAPSGDGHVHHPFIPPKSLHKPTATTTNTDDSSDNEGFLSQADLSQDNYSQEEEEDGSSAKGVVEFDGPRLDASIRQLTFDPRSSSSSFGGKYYLAIASESGNSPLVIADVASEHTSQTLYLGDKSCDQYEGCGIRSVAYSSLPSPNSSSSTTTTTTMLLATLGMDGKLVTFDVTSTSDPTLLWDVIHKDYSPVVTKELMFPDCNSGDKASCLVWDTLICNDDEGNSTGGSGSMGIPKAMLFMPGKTDIQYRTCPLFKKSSSSDDGSMESLTTYECKEQFKGPPKYICDENNNGHGDTIVAMAIQPPPAGTNDGENDDDDTGTKRILTGGRDGKLLMWEINVNDMTGSATEIPLTRPPGRREGSVAGIPPITSIVWYKLDELYVAFADGTVMMGPGSVEESDEVDDEEAEQLVHEEVDVDVDDSSAKKKVVVDEKKDDESEAEDSDDDTVALPTTQAMTQKVVGKDDDDDDDGKEMSDLDVDDDDEEEAMPSDKAATTENGNEGNANDNVTASSTSPSKTTTTSEPIEKGKSDDTSTIKTKLGDLSKFIDDEAEDGDDADEIQYDDVIETTAKSNDAPVEDGNDDAPADDTNFDADDDDMMFESNNNDPLDMDNTPAPSSNYFNAVPLQPAFAPSSTPLTEPRRILCWNHVGVVTLRNNESEENDTSMNLVDIAFHETAGLVGGRRPMTFTDNMGFIVGTLGDEGAMFASDLQNDEDDDDDDDDDDFGGLGVMSEVARKAVKRSKKKKKDSDTSSGGSQIYFSRFETFGRNADKDWVMALPDGERVLGCATGNGWGAVITR